MTAHYFPDASVDLIYLDPPFNSNRSYNVLFRDESGNDSDAQITAFEDSWHWGRSTEDLYTDLVTGADERLVNLISALVGDLDRPGLLGRNQMSAYLVMMAARLVELHRVLKPSGSLYLHCDPTASHYLKLVLDSVFTPLPIFAMKSSGNARVHMEAQNAGAQFTTHCFSTQHQMISPGTQPIKSTMKTMRGTSTVTRMKEDDTNV